MTQLWKVSGKTLKPVGSYRPKTEETLEDWIEKDPTILGLDILLISRQCSTSFGKRIDLLGIDREGNLTIIELKRDQTPRDVVAQTLDYASWIHSLKTKDVYEIAERYFKESLDRHFREKFGISPPDPLNTSHNMVIVAREFDDASKRIVEYLANAHGVSINTVFFGYFKDGDTEYMTADWLMDQQRVEEQAQDRRKAPWSGFYYVNSGHDDGVRSWDDMVKHGFVAAGYGNLYSGRLNQLSAGSPIFVYHKGAGYIGYGIVTSDASIMAKDFVTREGRKLSELNLKEPGILHHRDDSEQADYLVAVDWKKTFPISEAKWLDGGFRNQNIVCKLRHPATLDFLIKEFEAVTPK